MKNLLTLANQVCRTTSSSGPRNRFYDIGKKMRRAVDARGFNQLNKNQKKLPDPK